MKEILEEWGECIIYVIFGLIIVSSVLIFMKYANGNWEDNIIIKTLVNGAVMGIKEGGINPWKTF